MHSFHRLYKNVHVWSITPLLNLYLNPPPKQIIKTAIQRSSKHHAFKTLLATTTGSVFLSESMRQHGPVWPSKLFQKSHRSAQRELGWDTPGVYVKGDPLLVKAQSLWEPKSWRKLTPNSITNTSVSWHLEENVSDPSDRRSLLNFR